MTSILQRPTGGNIHQGMCSEKITISHGNIRVAVKVHFVRICFYLYKDSDESTWCFLTRKMSVSASAFKHGEEEEESGEVGARGRAA